MEKSMLNEATSADDRPTPGYMLSDISKQTLANYTACVQLQEFLASRVKKDDHNVKYKCLVIIKYVCRTGRPEFKKEMGRNIEAIKECLQYRGPPDPLRGDEIYKRVRDAAKEAIDAIYDSQMPTTTSAVAASNRIQGMGGGYVEDTTNKPKPNSSIFNSVSNVLGNFRNDTDATYTGHAGATSSFVGGNNNDSQRDNSSYNKNTSAAAYGTSTMSTSGMVGLGNPNFKDAREEKSFLERAQESAATMVSSLSSKMNSLNVDNGSKKFDSPDAGFGYVTNRGINAYGPSNQYTTGYGSQQPSPTWNSAGINSITTGTNNNETVGMGKAGNAASDGEYERGLINALCEPAGLKPVPPEDKLQAFLVTVVTLSPDVVGNCLLDVLNSESWQSRSKALQVIQSVGKARGCTKFVDWFTSNAADDLIALINDSKSSVRQQAEKTLKSLKLDASSCGSTSFVRREITETQVNLLDTDQMDMPSAVPPPVPVASNDDIFSGMQQNGRTTSNHDKQPATLPVVTTTESASNTATAAFDFLDDPIASSVPITSPVTTFKPPVVNNVAPSADATSSSMFEGLMAPSNCNIRPVMLPISSGMPMASVGMPLNYPNTNMMGNMNMSIGASVNVSATNTNSSNVSQFSFINNPSTASSGSGSGKGKGSDSFSFVQDVIKSSKK